MKTRLPAWLGALLLLTCAVPVLIAAWGMRERGEEEARPEPPPSEQPLSEPAALPAAAPEAMPAAAPLSPDLPGPAEEVTVRGRIRLVGNVPFTELVISDEEGNDWFIEGPAQDSLMSRQHETLTLRGEADYQDILLANGRRIGTRRILRNLTVYNTELQ
jgi:hypothetical protein